MAKDFGMKSKDLLDILEKNGRPAKNHMATLTPEEFDILICELSVANQVKKIDGYIYGETVIPRKEPKVEKKAEAAPAPAAPEKKPEAKAPEAKAPEVKASEKKPAPKAEPKPAQPAQKKPQEEKKPVEAPKKKEEKKKPAQARPQMQTLRPSPKQTESQASHQPIDSAQHSSSKVGKVRVVDTRSTNIDLYRIVMKKTVKNH